MESTARFKMPFSSRQDDDVTTASHEESVPSNSSSHPHPHLDLPSPLRRRTSHASIFSDLSDLDYMSNDHTAGLLRRRDSDVSDFSTQSYAGPVTLRQRLRHFWYLNYGAFLVLMSQVFGAGMNISARLLEQPGAHGEPMHPFQVLFVRQLLTVLLCTVYAVWTKAIPHFPLGPPDRKVRPLLMVRGVGGFLGVCGMYFSLQYLPLSEATVLTFLAPILTCYLCSLLLPGESFTRQQQLAGVVSFIGVILIAQPTTLLAAFTSASTTTEEDIVSPEAVTASSATSSHDPLKPTASEHLFAIGLAMMGVVGGTCAMIAIRAIGTRAHAFISIYYFSMLSVVISMISLIVLPDVSFRIPGNFTEWALLLSLGINGFILQALLTMGLAYGGPASASKPKTTPVAMDSIRHSNRVVGKDRTDGQGDEDIEMQGRSSPESSAIPGLSSSPPPTDHTRASKPKSAPSGNRATSMVYCQMLFALGADKVIFGTTLGFWSWIGIAFILSGAIWVAAAKDGGASESSKSRPRSNLNDPRHYEEVLPSQEQRQQLQEQNVIAAVDPTSTESAAIADTSTAAALDLKLSSHSEEDDKEDEEADNDNDKSVTLSASTNGAHDQ